MAPDQAQVHKVFGWWLPKTDSHFIEYLSQASEAGGRRVYQLEHLQTTLLASKRKRVAIDAGAHVGLWSYFLAQAFMHVHAFEPVPLFRQCFLLNVANTNVTLHPFALGAVAAKCNLDPDPANSGATYISQVGRGNAEMRALDEFALEEVDFIKIDVEGFELFVLEGARDTLLRCRPMVIVEQKEFGARYKLERRAPEEFLLKLGFTPVATVVHDTIFAWPG